MSSIINNDNDYSNATEDQSTKLVEQIKGILNVDKCKLTTLLKNVHLLSFGHEHTDILGKYCDTLKNIGLTVKLSEPLACASLQVAPISLDESIEAALQKVDNFQQQEKNNAKKPKETLNDPFMPNLQLIKEKMKK